MHPGFVPGAVIRTEWATVTPLVCVACASADPDVLAWPCDDGPNEWHLNEHLVPGREFRYDMTRRWARGPLLTFVMLNPSFADATTDDATTVRCMGFARREGMSGIRVVNMFAHRTHKPKYLDANSYGPDNDAAVKAALAAALVEKSPVVCAWGANKLALTSPARRLVLASKQIAPELIMSFKVSKSGEPWHPLYLPSEETLRPWPPE